MSPYSPRQLRATILVAATVFSCGTDRILISVIETAGNAGTTSGAPLAGSSGAGSGGGRNSGASAGRSGSATGAIGSGNYGVSSSSGGVPAVTTRSASIGNGGSAFGGSGASTLLGGAANDSTQKSGSNQGGAPAQGGTSNVPLATFGGKGELSVTSLAEAGRQIVGGAAGRSDAPLSASGRQSVSAGAGHSGGPSLESSEASGGAPVEFVGELTSLPSDMCGCIPTGDLPYCSTDPMGNEDCTIACAPVLRLCGRNCQCTGDVVVDLSPVDANAQVLCGSSADCLDSERCVVVYTVLMPQRIYEAICLPAEYL